MGQYLIAETPRKLVQAVLQKSETTVPWRKLNNYGLGSHQSGPHPETWNFAVIGSHMAMATFPWGPP